MRVAVIGSVDDNGIHAESLGNELPIGHVVKDHTFHEEFTIRVVLAHPMPHLQHGYSKLACFALHTGAWVFSFEGSALLFSENLAKRTEILAWEPCKE